MSKGAFGLCSMFFHDNLGVRKAPSASRFPERLRRDKACQGFQNRGNALERANGPAPNEMNIVHLGFRFSSARAFAPETLVSVDLAHERVASSK